MTLASVKFNPKAASLRLKKELKAVANDKRLEQDYGEFLTERVRYEARRGKPLNDDRKFPPLSDASVAIRERLAGKNKTNSAYAANKSNLTFTGQLLDAVAFKRTKTGLFEIFVKPTGRRKIVGNPNTARLNNEDVDNELRRGVTSRQYGKRKFVAFTAKGLKSNKQIPKRLRAILLRFLRRQLRRG